MIQSCTPDQPSRQEAALRNKLETVEFEPTSYCLLHGQPFPATPRHSDEHKDMHWVEAAGTICKPFSVLSSNPHWCDPSTLCTLSWTYCTRYDEPDEICQESVAPMEHEVLFNIFSNTNVLKCPCAKPIPRHTSYAGYRHKHKVFSPVDLGVPSSRRRTYCWFSLMYADEVDEDPGLGKIPMEDLCFPQIGL